MARRSFTEIATGAAVLLVAGGFLAYAVTNTGRGSAGDGYRLTASFDHIDGLAVGSDVRLAGVKVGRVTSASIDPRTYLAVVGLTVQDGISLATDSSAEIVSESLLGGKFLSITPGGAESVLKPGEAFKLTQGSVSLEQLLGKFIFSVTNMNKAGPASSPAPLPQK